MSGVYAFFEKIQKQILDLQNSINQFQQSWEKVQKFWDLFFTIVPWEVLLLLVFSVIFLSIFNSVSPSTPKSNLTIVVLLLAGVWAYFWGLFSEDVSYLKIIFTSLYILLPVHIFGIGNFGYKYIQKWNLTKKRIRPRTWEESLDQISRDYNQMMSSAYGKTESVVENAAELKTKIANLEASLSGLKGLFPK